MCQAEELFPTENWIYLGEGIFIAESRLPVNSVQEKILEKEIAQLKILTVRGSVAYLLPEKGKAGKYPDALINGKLVELKTVIGNNIQTLAERFNDARSQCENVFIKIDSDLLPKAVKRQIKYEIRENHYEGGEVILYFTRNRRIYRIPVPF